MPLASVLMLVQLLIIMVLLYLRNPYTFMFLLKFLVAGISLLNTPPPPDREELICYSHLNDGMVIHICDCLSHLHMLEKCYRRTNTHFYSGVRIGEASNPGPSSDECPHLKCTTTCIHGLSCTIDGHMHAAGILDGRKRRIAEQAGKKKKTQLRLTLCKSLRVSECGTEDHYHCSSSTCHCIKAIIQMMETTDAKEEKYDTSLYDPDSSSSETDDPPPPLPKTKKQLRKERDVADYAAIEEEGNINQALPRPPTKAESDVQGMGLTPTPPPLKTNPRQPVVVELNTDSVPCNAGDEVTSIDLKTFLSNTLDCTPPTKRVMLFVNCTVQKDYVPLLKRIRDFVLLKCPFTRTAVAVNSNELHPHDSVTEAQTVMETQLKEVKFFWKNYDQHGDLLSSNTGDQIYFKQYYPGYYWGTIYIDVTKKAMRDPLLLRPQVINRAGDISESVLCLVTDWYGRNYPSEDRSVTITTDTLVHIVNQLVARYGKLRSAVTGSAAMDFRTGGRAHTTRASRRTRI